MKSIVIMFQAIGLVSVGIAIWLIVAVAIPLLLTGLAVMAVYFTIQDHHDQSNNEKKGK